MHQNLMLMPESVTLVEDAIHLPSEPRHYMTIKPLLYPVGMSFGEDVLVRSSGAVRVQEIGKKVYDPVIYFPKRDIDMQILKPTGHKTHCPLKGDAEYFDLLLQGEVKKNAAWSYQRVQDFDPALQQLLGKIAFDTSVVRITENTNYANPPVRSI